ncbi:MAG: beta-phosphoglucomutase [Flavobacteriales bacterium]|nr:beta-phosphoglucomutase [Flavobacteriales bacterium]
MDYPQAVIFDMDGVIVDTVDAHFLAWKAMADELDIPFSEADNENLKGVSRTDSMKRILAMGGMEKTDEEIAELTDRKNKMYVNAISQMTADDILPGVMQFIGELKDHGVHIAVGSSSRNTPTILKAVGLDHAFDAIVDGNQVKHAKPDPEVFLKGAEKLALEPDKCIVLEDARSGIEAAHRAGMKCIGVGEAHILTEADLVVPDLTELTITNLIELQ